MWFCASCNLLGDPYMHMKPEERKTNSSNLVRSSFDYDRTHPRNIQHLQKAIALDPNNDRAHKELAETHRVNDNYIGWKESIDKAVELAPSKWKSDRAYHLLFTYRQFDDALVDLYGIDLLISEEIQIPMHTSIAIMKGLAYLEKQQYKKAQEYFIEYIESINVNETLQIEARYYLGLCLEKQSKWDEALIHFIEAAQKSDEPAFYVKAAKIYLLTENIPEARKYLLQAESLFCADPTRQYTPTQQLYTIEEGDIFMLKSIIDNL